MRLFFLLLGSMSFAAVQLASTPSTPMPFTVHNASAVAEHSQTLIQKARSLPDGFASEQWEKFGHSYMMLAARVKQGGAEVHTHSDDYFVVLQGHATEQVGGTVIGANETTPGEIRGTGINGGEKRLLGPGDIVHISATTPHQTLMSAEPFVYFIIKVQE